MKLKPMLILTLFMGFGLGVVTAQNLRAQAKAPIYYIAEIQVTNPDAYMREYDPKAQAILKAAGGRILAAGQNVATIEGQPAKSHVVVQVWESMEKIQTWLNSPELKEVNKIGNKHAKFRAFTVEGLPQ